MMIKELRTIQTQLVGRLMLEALPQRSKWQQGEYALRKRSLPAAISALRQCHPALNVRDQVRLNRSTLLVIIMRRPSSLIGEIVRGKTGCIR